LENPVKPHRALDPRDLAKVAVFAALIAVLGLPGAIPVFGGAVPITAQTLGVMLAGAILGPWLGALSVIVFEVLVAIGLPLLSGGRGGVSVFVGPSAGYLFGWIAGAFVIGLILWAGGHRPTWFRAFVACVVGGIGVIYAIGIPVQAWVTHIALPQTALLSLAFIPGDVLKAVLAATITMLLWRAYPPAFAGYNRRRAEKETASAPLVDAE
jgi:biotin transport system substrate-specific component